MPYVLLIALAVVLLITHHVVLGAVVFALALMPLLFLLCGILLTFVAAVIAGK